MERVQVGSGIHFLDQMISSFNIGDNVVWQVETGAFVELYCRAFIQESIKDDKDVIYVSFNNSPKNIAAKIGPSLNNPNVTIIDCFTSGKGDNSSIFLDLYKTTYKKFRCKLLHAQKPDDPAEFIRIINEIEESKPRGTRYVFDSLTGMQDLWGTSDQIMKFFTRQCPRLYELDTIAYWILEKNAHSEQFRAQINHITQVVIDLSIENGVCALSVIKADNHPEREVHKSHRYEVSNGNIEFLESPDAGTVHIGKKIKDVRLSKEISQAQLAAAIGVTPSTISQVENNAITLSLPALVRLARALNIPVGTLFGEEEPKAQHFLFRGKHRSLNVFRGHGITFDSILPGELQERIETYIVNIAPDAESNAHFFTKKNNEFGFLLEGTLELEMNGKTYTMNEGDAVCFTANVPSLWKNTSEQPAKLLWVVCR